MAEGGSHAIHSDSPQLDSHLLECPICLEQQHQPKSLPCLHSFCQECLSTFITKDLSGKMATATSFPCPICRKMTQPVDLSEGKEKWAQQFPANSLIHDMVEAKAEDPFYCKPCERKGNARSPAKVWCNTCKVLLCESCKGNLHDLVHEGCDTVLVSGSEGFMMSAKGSSTEECEKHTEKMTYYCEDHKVVGCSRCIMADHKRCEWTSTQDFCEQLRRNSRLDKLKKSLQKVTEDIEALLKEFCEQLKNMTDDQDIAFKSVTDLRQRVDTHLDALQKNITDELVTVVKERKENVEMSAQKCERLMSSVRNTLEASENANLRNNNMETVLMYQRGQTEVELWKTLSNEMRETFTSVRLQHEVDTSLVKCDKTTHLSMGKIIIKKEPGCLSIQLAKPLTECSVKKIRTFSIKRPTDSKDCYARGVVYFPSDQIVVTDGHNRKLKLFTAEGQFMYELTFEGEPYDICRVDDTNVAVCVQSPSTIHVVNVDNSKLIPTSQITLPYGEECQGISYTGESFVLSSDTYLVKVTKDGKTDTMQGLGGTCFHMTHDSKRGYIFASVLYSVLYSDVIRIDVSRLSDTTTTKHLKMDVAKKTFGIDVDSHVSYRCPGTEQTLEQCLPHRI